ncbi:MAG TPA: zf-HC2 domain-containing protein [Mucilaginibacter sp.]|nr:zf-HC2 domain-containing protein [Mucilaginibacter sp.]
MKNMEEKIWEYIDGTCSEEERRAIDALIAQDASFRRKYEELLSLHREFSAIESDEPPMAFTYNVMEAIRSEYAQHPLKAQINKRIIRVITWFFILSIVFFLVLFLSNLHLTPVKLSVHLPVSLKVPDMSKYLSWPLIEGFIFLDVVLALFLFDGYLRRKKASGSV